MRFLCLVAGLLISSSALSASFPAPTGTQYEGDVVRVKDGDTIVVLDAERVQHNIRMANIDAPEHAQPWGERSKEHLSRLCFGKRVRVVVTDQDRHWEREVALIVADGVESNTAQVAAGMAWVYDRYNRDTRLPSIQSEARAARRGLWADQLPIPPWEFRREKRGGAPARP